MTLRKGAMYKGQKTRDMRKMNKSKWQIAECGGWKIKGKE